MNHIYLTDDGSKTLISDRFGEAYHSRRGALTESMHVFIRHGLDFAALESAKNPLQVGEIGLGTGLNAMLACQWARKNAKKVHYTALEPYPVAQSVWQEFQQENWVEDRELYQKLMACQPGKELELNELFHFSCFPDLWPETSRLSGLDVLFYDAFAPATQPELWGREALESAYRALRPGGVLVTYCAKSEVKRTLKSIGFLVERLPGPPGKREMTRAIKP